MQVNYLKHIYYNDYVLQLLKVYAFKFNEHVIRNCKWIRVDVDKYSTTEGQAGGL